jgi:hypothetical protein
MTKLQGTLDCPFKTNDPEYLVQLSCGRHFADLSQWQKHKEEQGSDEPPCPYCKQPVTEVESPLPMRIINQYIQDIKSRCTELDEVLKRNRDAANLIAYSSSQPQTIPRIPNNQDSWYSPSASENVVSDKIERSWKCNKEVEPASNLAIPSVDIAVWTPDQEERSEWPYDNYQPLPLEIPDPAENNYDLYSSLDELNDAHNRVWKETREIRQARNQSHDPITPVEAGDKNSFDLNIPNTHTARKSTETIPQEPTRKPRATSEPPPLSTSNVGGISPKARTFGRCTHFALNVLIFVVVGYKIQIEGWRASTSMME